MRTRLISRVFASLSVAFAGGAAAIGLFAPGAQAATCPAPTFSVNPDTAPPGGSFNIGGSNWFRSCPDPAPAGQETPPNERDTGIRIVFSQGGTDTLIGTASAGSDGVIAGTVFVPAKASSGGATVRAEGTNGQPSVGFTVEGAAVTTTTAPGATTSTTAKPATTSTTAKATTTTTAKATTTTTGSTTTTAVAPVTTAVPPTTDGTGGEREFGVGGVESSSTKTDADRARTAKILAVGAMVLVMVAALFYLASRVDAEPVPVTPAGGGGGGGGGLAPEAAASGAGVAAWASGTSAEEFDDFEDDPSFEDDQFDDGFDDPEIDEKWGADSFVEPAPRAAAAETVQFDVDDVELAGETDADDLDDQDDLDDEDDLDESDVADADEDFDDFGDDAVADADPEAEAEAPVKPARPEPQGPTEGFDDFDDPDDE